MIYDCFTFFNELEVLEIRLNILDPVVDKFVLVEATKNHQGKDKPLYFEENKERFAKFLPKIIHVVVRDYPPNPQNNTWVFEHHQRNCIADGLKQAKADDIILISDLDEIPKPETVRAHKDEPGVKILRQKMFYYFINCVNESESAEGNYLWNGTVMIHFSDIRNGKIQEFRELSMRLLAWFLKDWKRRAYWRFRLKRELKNAQRDVHFIDDGGWHFSYLGGVDRIIKKLESFAHDEYNRDEFKDPKKIEEAINNGRDILGRDFRYRFVKIDDSYPEWLLQNLERFPHLVKK
ncbi:MAG TPA: hypothetical protein VFU15_08175 [Bacteroidia bacterium]|nr:hypothetical protein [Bacteroidia bacterium]